MLEILFWLGLALSPLYNVLLFQPAGFELSAVDIIWLLALVLWTLSVVTKRRLLFSMPLLFLILFVILSLISAGLAEQWLVAFKRWGRTLLRVLVFCFLMPSLMYRSKHWKVYIGLFVISGVVFGILNYIDLFIAPQAFFQSFFANPLRPVANLRFIYPDPELTTNTNYGHEIGHWDKSSLLLIFALGLAAGKWRERLAWSILAIPALITLVLSLTKSAWLGLGVGIVYMLYRLYFTSLIHVTPSGITLKTRKFLALFLIVALVFTVGSIAWFVLLPPGTRNLVLLAFTLQDVTSLSRVQIWNGLIPIILDNPIFGVGWGNLVARGLSTDPHSWWFGVLAETGLLGFALYAFFYVSVLVRATQGILNPTNEYHVLRIASAAALIGLGIAGFFEMSFMWSVNSWFVIGLAVFFGYRGSIVSTMALNSAVRFRQNWGLEKNLGNSGAHYG